MVTGDRSWIRKTVMCRIQGCHGTARRNADYCLFHIGLAMDCPKCGVQPGQWCKNKGGGRANEFHVKRTERSKAAFSLPRT